MCAETGNSNSASQGKYLNKSGSVEGRQRHLKFWLELGVHVRTVVFFLRSGETFFDIRSLIGKYQNIAQVCSYIGGRLAALTNQKFTIFPVSGTCQFFIVITATLRPETRPVFAFAFRGGISSCMPASCSHFHSPALRGV